MENIQVITQTVQKEMEAFIALYREALYSHVNDFQLMLDFVSSKKGKYIRPLVLILSAKLCKREISQDTLEYAVILELLHTATLIHDDVVDNTQERRGQPSVMAKFDNRIAVLLGDYILSQSIIRGVNMKNFFILKILSQLAQDLVEGELTQLISSTKIIIEEQRYFQVIRKKTATLFASCTEIGALSVLRTPAEQTETLRQIGENLGLCFQLKDDMFDYFEQGDIGKPTGNDIREGKITLPLIHALKVAPQEDSQAMMSLIQKQDFSQENIKRLIVFAKKHNGIEYAQRKMQEIKEKTSLLLDRFPDSTTKTTFIHLIDYIIDREK
jgi:octaprenyl-diphosphate synthase